MKWFIRADYRNCGNEKCRRGCVRGGVITANRPHGPYYIIYTHIGAGENRRQINRYIGVNHPSEALLQRIEDYDGVPTREMIKKWQ